ncbi:uncharacterized protein LOC110841902 [Folsomia candida]|uniref:Uncharacterized protein n=1 Tax=Folsomia candida TaxID=158441 RepID=A0A226EUV1_FOLCA|nr:uncharacterized protein LOC110841902 [Folsomia candida]OXA61299.1 hypothetical protein Fcan01_00261 [Folsomia candida]
MVSSAPVRLQLTMKMKTLLILVCLVGCASLASAQVKYSHDVAVAKVQAAGIPIWSSGGCSDRYNPSCTSLEQVNANSIDSGSGGITVFKSASGCPVTITGGTETGHGNGAGFSHWNGYKIDISLNSCVDNWIYSAYTFIGNRPGDNAPQYQSAAGNIYAREIDHWDITYY